MRLEKILIEKIIKSEGEGQNGHWERTEVLLHDIRSQVETRCLARLQKRVLEQWPNLKEGEEYDVDINLSCREYNGKYYNEVSVWQITPAAF